MRLEGEVRGVGKKVGSWEGEKVRLNQDRGKRTDDRGVGKKLGSWESEKVRLNKDRGQRILKSEVGMRKSEKGIGKAEFKDINAINFNQSHI
jgi:hypothetical protein